MKRKHQQSARQSGKKHEGHVNETSLEALYDSSEISERQHMIICTTIVRRLCRTR